MHSSVVVESSKHFREHGPGNVSQGLYDVDVHGALFESACRMIGSS